MVANMAVVEKNITKEYPIEKINEIREDLKSEGSPSNPDPTHAL